MQNMLSNMQNMSFQLKMTCVARNMQNMQLNMLNMQNMSSLKKYAEYALPTLLMNAGLCSELQVVMLCCAANL